MFYGWYVAFSCGALLFLTMIGQTPGVNMAVEHWIKDLDITRSQVSTLWFSVLALSAVGLPFAGRLVDRVGGRKTVLLSALPYALVVGALGTVQSWQALFVCLIVVRFIGCEVLTLVAYVTPTKWFIKRRGAAATMLAIWNGGSVAFSSIFQHLIDPVGWRHAYMILSGVVLVVLMAICAVLQDSPDCVDAYPDGASQEPQPPAAAKDVEEAEDEAGGLELDWIGTPFTSEPSFKDVLARPSFWAVSMPYAMYIFFWSGFNYHAPDIIMLSAGFSPQEVANQIFIPLSVGITTFAISSGLWLDCVHTSTHLTALGCVYLVMSGCMLSTLYITSTASAVPIALFYGCTIGCIQSLNFPLYAYLFGTAHQGAVQSLGVAISILFSGGGTLLFGLARDYTGDYHLPISACSVGLALSSIGIWLLAKQVGKRDAIEAKLEAGSAVERKSLMTGDTESEDEGSRI